MIKYFIIFLFILGCSDENWQQKTKPLATGESLLVNSLPQGKHFKTICYSLEDGTILSCIRTKNNLPDHWPEIVEKPDGWELLVSKNYTCSMKHFNYSNKVSYKYSEKFTHELIKSNYKISSVISNDLQFTSKTPIFEKKHFLSGTDCSFTIPK